MIRKHTRPFGIPLSCVGLLLFTLGSCGGPDSRKGSAEEGNVEMVVMALSAADATSVTVTITAADIASPIVVALAKSGTQWGGKIGGIPAGTDRTFTLSARDAAGTEVYSGQITGVTIAPGQTATVLINAQQSTPPSPRKNAVPVIDALVASAVAVAPGDVVSLSVTAHDPDPSDTLTYDWRADEGTFSAPSAAQTNWTAPAGGGTYPITIRVRDQRNAQASMSLDISVAASNGRGKAAVTVSFNTWPVIGDVTADPTRIHVGQSTALNATATDSDGDTLAFAWSSECAGSFSSTGVQSPTFTLAALPVNGACTFAVVVTDGRGGSSGGDVTLPVGPAPTLDIAPQILTTYQSLDVASAGAVVTLRVQAVDPNGTALTFNWTATAGTVGAPNTTANTSEVLWTAPASFGAEAEILATITDATEQTTVQSFRVTPAQPTLLTTISVPAGNLHGVAVNPNTNRIYVSRWTANAVTVIDGSTNAVIADLAAASAGVGVAVNPNTDRVYVSGWSDLTVHDGTTHALVATIGTAVPGGGSGAIAGGVAVNPNTNLIYASAGHGGVNMLVIDGATNAVVGTIPGFNGASWGVAVNPVTNRVYAPSGSGNHVKVVDGIDHSVLTTIPVGTSPQGTGVNPNTNKIYVANAGSDSVSVIDGVSNLVLATIAVGTAPTAIAVNPDTDRIYVANSGSSSLSVIDGPTNTVAATVPAGTEIQSDGVDVNAATGRIYLANRGQSTVSVIADPVAR